MKIALIGYGKMGHIIEQIACSRGHEIVSIIDINNQQEFDSPAFKSADVAIEFTAPAVALANYRRAFAAGVKVVSGTTGWLDHIAEIKQACAQGSTLFWASNFSLGVNLFMALNSYLAELMEPYSDYQVHMTETHHIHKLDAPSGTAITLAEGIIDHLTRKSQWVNHPSTDLTDLIVESLRQGEVPGIHEIIYESDCDTISIKHDAKSRVGFALGAVMAAEYTHQHQGFLGMTNMLGF